MLHGYVSRLRRELGGGVLQTSADGYVLAVGDDQLDAVGFEAALASGREALRAGEPAAALRELTAALGAWRGPALADVADQQFARVDAERLDELRMAAEEERVEARLALGEHAELLGDLTALVERNSLREGLRAQLMLALYRSDRQLDALAVYRETRRHLSAEFGIEPARGCATSSARSCSRIPRWPRRSSRGRRAKESEPAGRGDSRCRSG